jgi:hypothetical protein
MFVDRNGSIGALGSYRSSSGMVMSLKVWSVRGAIPGKRMHPPESMVMTPSLMRARVLSIGAK